MAANTPALKRSRVTTLLWIVSGSLAMSLIAWIGLVTVARFT
jgi:hypothetical protein